MDQEKSEQLLNEYFGRNAEKRSLQQKDDLFQAQKLKRAACGNLNGLNRIFRNIFFFD